MIEKVCLTSFKKFTDTEFNLLPDGLTFLAGGNNSGKSTLLQALAVWEFCKTVLRMERGPESLCDGYARQGLGISDDEFSPVAVASLKHMWTNLRTQVPGTKDGYSLAVKCQWNDAGGISKHLQISLALTNDRLFIKAGSTNLALEDEIPSVAYLPPFAGMDTKERPMSVAERRAMIGRGLAGGVIRNFLSDMHRTNEEKRKKLKEGRTKIKNSDLARLRENDPWEILQRYLGENFKTQLSVQPFNELYHTHIRIDTIKGEYDGNTFKRFVGFKARDLMSEGSGFLQMLSVYTLALSPETEVVLLDEPDAHLHTSLQYQLIERLEGSSIDFNKQILIATHSTEILRHAEFSRIMQVKGTGGKYLTEADQKVGLFVGLGSEYSPKLDPLRKHGRMLIVENLSDERLLKAWAVVVGKQWPKNLVTWPWPNGSKQRKQLYTQLKTEIANLKAISIVDRDDIASNCVDKTTLRDKANSSPDPNLLLRVWARRHIENYLLCPAAVARASGVPEVDVIALIAEHALVVPNNFVSKDVAEAMLDARGKEITQEHPNSFLSKFGTRPLDIAKAMQVNEVPEDVETLLQQIIELCE